MALIKEKIILFLICLVCFTHLTMAQSNFSMDPGFESIFNGKNLKGWVTPEEEEGLTVNNNVLEIKGKESPDIVHAIDNIGNFVLRFEYQLPENGNSGVLIRYNKNDPKTSGIEIQLGLSGNESYGTGAIFNIVPGKNPYDELAQDWHSMEIVCDRKQIIVAVDGKIITWANYDNITGLGNKNLEGMLGFQRNHYEEAPWFKLKNLRIKNLDKDPQYVLDGFTYADGEVRKQAHGKAVRLKTEMVKKLCENIDNKNLQVASGSRKALREIVARASNPQNEADKRDRIMEVLENYHSKSRNKFAEQFIEEQLKLLQAN